MRLPQLRLRIALLLTSLFSILFSIPPLMAANAPPQPADIIITNARIYTVNPHQKWAEAIAVRGDKIVDVGSSQEIERYRGASTLAIDAKQHLVLPGFVDCHIHFLDGALSLLQVNLDQARAVAEIQQQVKAYAG